MYKIYSVGSGTNGWYHITHPALGFCGQARGYKKALQRVIELEAKAIAQQPKVDTHNFYAQQITSTKRNK